MERRENGKNGSPRRVSADDQLRRVCSGGSRISEKPVPKKKIERRRKYDERRYGNPGRGLSKNPGERRQSPELGRLGENVGQVQRFAEGTEFFRVGRTEDKERNEYRRGRESADRRIQEREKREDPKVRKCRRTRMDRDDVSYGERISRRNRFRERERDGGKGEKGHMEGATAERRGHDGTILLHPPFGKPHFPCPVDNSRFGISC